VAHDPGQHCRCLHVLTKKVQWCFWPLANPPPLHPVQESGPATLWVEDDKSVSLWFWQHSDSTALTKTEAKDLHKDCKELWQKMCDTHGHTVTLWRTLLQVFKQTLQCNEEVFLFTSFHKSLQNQSNCVCRLLTLVLLVLSSAQWWWMHSCHKPNHWLEMI
jgi:hypothetical protein